MNQCSVIRNQQSEPLNLAYHLYRNLNMMCHSLISYPRFCPLDMYASFPGMMQDDKGNIKVNLGIALGSIVVLVYFAFTLTQHYTTLANQEQLSRLMEYLHLNGGYELVPVQNRGSCMFAAIIRGMGCVQEIYKHTSEEADCVVCFTECSVYAHISDIRTWMRTNLLKLNDDKTEVMLIGTRQQLSKLPEVTVKIGDESINPTETAQT